MQDLDLVCFSITGNTNAVGKGEGADKQKLSGMDAASQPPGRGSRRFCVQPPLPELAAGPSDDMLFKSAFCSV